MDHLIQARPLFGRREARPPYRPRRQRRDRRGGAPPVPRDLALGQGIVLCQVHAYQLGCQVEHERCVQLAAVRRTARVVEVAGEVQVKDVDSEHPSPPGPQRREGLLVRVVAVRGKNNEGIYAT